MKDSTNPMSMVQLQVEASGVAVININQPQRSVNLLNPELIAALASGVESVLGRDEIKGAVITSSKAGFIAGADLRELAEAYTQGISAHTAARRFSRENALLRRIETGGKPFVAAMNGVALGGGLELALACHHRLLVDHPKALIGLPEVTVGLLPGGGGTQRLPRLIGIEAALLLLLDGAPVSPRRAFALGIVDALVGADDLVAAACEWVLLHPQAVQPWDVPGYRIPGGSGPLAEHANRSFAGQTADIRRRTQDNYPAPVAILSAVYEGTQLSIDQGLAVEARYFGQLLAGPVARNLMRTMFINRGRADKLERRPAAVARSQVRRLGVLGAGMMGRGIARVAAQAGIQVILLDSEQTVAERGKAAIRAGLEKDAARHGETSEAVDSVLDRITAVQDFPLLAGCDLVIEAVFENRAVKADVIRRTAQYLPASAVLASNTSTLPISALAECGQRPAQFIGLHFFSPVERMPLVEVIVGRQTASDTLAKALDVVAQLRRTPIVVNDSPGFYTSRIFCSYIDEGMAMLVEGIAPALIENAARMAGMATGPLAVTDEVSLDLQMRVVEQAQADGLPQERLRLHAQPVIAKLNALGRLGRKSGGGFYAFAGGTKRLWPGLAALYPPREQQPEVQEVIDRLLFIQALESARCMEEGVVTAPMDADLGAVLGLGFPRWTGGPISFIDTLGIESFVSRCTQLAVHGTRFEPSAWLRERAERGVSFYEEKPHA